METSQRDEHIERALAALKTGQANETLTLCQTVLEDNMEDAEAWSIYGLAGIKFEPEKAIQALQRAVQLEPRQPRWRIHLGVGFNKTGKHVEAEQVLLGAMELTDNADEAVIPWTNALLQLGQLDKVKTALREVAAVKKSPALWLHLSNVLTANDDLIGSVAAREKAYEGLVMPDPEKFNIANMHVTLGQFDDSQKYVDALMASDSSLPETILLAANLNRWRGDLDAAHELLSDATDKNKDDPRLLLALLDLNNSEDDDRLDAAKTCVENIALPMATRRGLAFVIARRADKSGQYDEAWQYAVTANGLYDDGATSQTEQYRQQLKKGLNLFSATTQQPIGSDAKHIYLIGPPRSGGSLLQTILAAAPGLASVGERGALMAWILPLLEQEGADDQTFSEWNRIAPDLQKADTAGIIRSIIDETAQTFVDKMPHHAHVAGLLHRIHPKAQFVDVRRDPFDMATSILFHDFTDKFGYSRSVSDIAEYLRFQRDAIHAWQKAGLEINIHDHAAFLDTPEQSGAALFKSLGLNWADSYLDPKNRTSTVRTFSALQVRSKVTKAYSGRGERYKQFMGDDVRLLEGL